MSYNEIFDLGLPPGWEDQTVYVFRGPSDEVDEHVLMLMVDRHPQLEEIRDFSRQKTVPIIQAFPGIEILKDEETTIESGNPAWEFVYKSYVGDKAVFQKYVYVLCGGMGFTFTCKFSKTTYKTVGLQMKQVIDSLVPGTYEPVEED